ncbi:hypothetical protein V6N13_109865 [Hibiscus sabdariffa]|uniref:Uncharacterized protein n=1 Tax=Hibiscus sabdariffa TaxID=183260 RepID=A0ABR2FQQ6_9ROSI
MLSLSGVDLRVAGDVHKKGLSINEVIAVEVINHMFDGMLNKIGKANMGIVLTSSIDLAYDNMANEITPCWVQTAMTERPGVMTEKVSVGIRKHVVLTERLSAMTEKVDVGIEKHVALTERPGVVTEKVVAVIGKPDALIERPTAITERPCAVTEKLGVVNGKPGVASETVHDVGLREMVIVLVKQVIAATQPASFSRRRSFHARVEGAKSSVLHPIKGILFLRLRVLKMMEIGLLFAHKRWWKFWNRNGGGCGAAPPEAFS